MVAFGKRLSRKSSRTAALGDPGDDALRASPRRLGLFWIALAILTYFLLAIVAFMAWESTLPAPKDEAPGFKVDIGPYVIVKGCPTRKWAVGEYLPAACGTDNTFAPSHGHLYGLDYLRRSKGFIRRHSIRWVRQSSDALGVMCPSFSPCLIETVVPDKFLGPPSPATPGMQSFDFSHPPSSFWMGYMFDILIGAMPLAVILFLYLNERPKPRTPPDPT